MIRDQNPTKPVCHRTEWPSCVTLKVPQEVGPGGVVKTQAQSVDTCQLLWVSAEVVKRAGSGTGFPLPLAEAVNPSSLSRPRSQHLICAVEIIISSSSAVFLVKFNVECKTPHLAHGS